MAAGRFIVGPYFPARDQDNVLSPGAFLYVYENGTTTKATIYTDEAMTVLSSNPVIANASGQFPAVWGEAGTADVPVGYTVMVTASDGSSLGTPSTFDDFYPSLNWENANITLAEAAATAADASADAAAASATASAASAVSAAADLAEIEDIAANAPDAPSIVNKANLNGDNVSGSNATAFRTALGAVSSAALLLGSGASLIGFLSDATDAVYRLVSGKLNDVKSIKDFGASSSNTPAQNTAAMVKAVAWMTAVPAKGRQLTVPSEEFKVSAAITIPFCVGWAIVGASSGGSIICQDTDNTPVFKLTGDLTHSWNISDLTLTYTNSQPYANTEATCIQFATGAGSHNIFNFNIQRVNFSRGRRGISCDTVTTQLAVWGFSIRDCTFGSGLTGSAIYLRPNVSVGQPIMHFERLYIDSAGAAPNEPSMQFGPSESAAMISVEFNNGVYNGSHAQVYAPTCFNVLLLNSKSEVTTPSAGIVLWDFPQSNVNVQNVCFNGITATGTGVRCIQANSGGSLSVSGFYGATLGGSAGTIFPYVASSLGVIQGVSIDSNFTEALRSNLGNVAVPQVRVKALSPNVTYTIPDSALSITIPDSAANLYRTTAARTANRTITLPSTGVLDGMVFTFVIRAADVASFSQTISDPLSGLTTVVPAGAPTTTVVYRAVSSGAYIITSLVKESSFGTATLVAGTVTVSTSAVLTGDKIVVSCNTPGGTQGILSAPVASIVNATSFVINSSNAADTSTVNWMIVR